MEKNISESLEDLRDIIREFYSLAEYSPITAKEYNESEFWLLDKDTHAQYALNTMLQLGKGYQSIDSGQPWIPYWLTNILEITENSLEDLPKMLRTKLIKYLTNLHNNETGGFRGAKSLQSHVASTYGAILAIANIAWEDAYKIVDKKLMKEFLKSVFWRGESKDANTSVKSSELKVGKNGSYIMHENGEYDLRGCYCALVVADILGLLPDEELTAGMGDFIASCQTYEGGISWNPYGEAHAGYTFCGLASMILLGEAHKLDMNRLIEWTTNRQLEIEGGFNGRVNKLVDSWYNFWIGSVFELIDIALEGKGNINGGEWLNNQLALQGYTIFCCQNSEGGLKDKPRKHVDVYHTMYSLAGTSICQYK